MAKRFHILIFIVVIGFYLMPALSNACEINSGKSCCDTEACTFNYEKNESCNDFNQSKNKVHNGSCNGKCGHSNCTTSSVQFSIAFFEIKFKNHNFDFSEIKQNYFKSEGNISSGFFSIWLIPKIS